MKYYYNADFEKQREKLLNSPVAQHLISNIIKNADSVLNEEYKALKISDYMQFIETGDRKVFEREYFKRRNNCSLISIAYWLTNDEKYKKPLVDLVFHICDEYTWCLPAHVYLENNPSPELFISAIDLFQSETARLLTDIAAMVGDNLPYYVTDRIAFEIRRRIIEALKTREFGWYTKYCTNNWAAVCAGGTGVAVLHYATEEEKKKLIPLLNGAMENFLSGFNDDGCCLEGYNYWSYGFGYYLIYAMAIYDYSQGKINLFANDKVKQIALYPQKVRMGTKKVASFSDGSSEFSFSPGKLSLLRKLYGKEVVYPPLELGTNRGNVFSLTSLLWFDTEYEADENRYLTSYFENSEWFIKQGKKYSFAAKGGHNDEPHNHNDIGSFMLVTADDDIPLADLGSAIYRKETFDPQYRYTLLNNSSWGHSVPIINGQYQLAGEMYRAKNARAGADFFELDIEGAYEEGLVSRITRSFTFNDSSLALLDTIEYSDKTNDITERFVSRTKPEIFDSYVDLGSAKIMFDKEKYTVSVSTDSYRNHADTQDISVFFIDFRALAPKETIFEFHIVIK